jgi:hypothetical protein
MGKGNATTDPISVDTTAVDDVLPVDTRLPVTNFTCDRCGFVYQKQFDHPPYLCHRCLRFLGKGIFKLYNQLNPQVSSPPATEG